MSRTRALLDRLVRAVERERWARSNLERHREWHDPCIDGCPARNALEDVLFKADFELGSAIGDARQALGTAQEARE